jgi:bacterioferritin
MAKKGNKKIIALLNEDRGYELAAIIQYLGHHYEVAGMESPSLQDIFKETAIDEMKHAEELAERLVYLGGIPTQKPTMIKRGGSTRKMIKDDLTAEYGAIERYEKHIKICDKLGDTTTRRMLEKILANEEEHADTWEGILEKR